MYFCPKCLDASKYIIYSDDHKAIPWTLIVAIPTISRGLGADDITRICGFANGIYEGWGIVIQRIAPALISTSIPAKDSFINFVKNIMKISDHLCADHFDGESKTLLEFMNQVGEHLADETTKLFVQYSKKGCVVIYIGASLYYAYLSHESRFQQDQSLSVPIHIDISISSSDIQTLMEGDPLGISKILKGLGQFLLDQIAFKRLAWLESILQMKLPTDRPVLEPEITRIFWREVCVAVADFVVSGYSLRFMANLFQPIGPFSSLVTNLDAFILHSHQSRTYVPGSIPSHAIAAPAHIQQLLHAQTGKAILGRKRDKISAEEYILYPLREDNNVGFDTLTQIRNRIMAWRRFRDKFKISSESSARYKTNKQIK